MNLYQRSDDWQAERIGKITASRIKDLGAKPQKGKALNATMLTILSERLTGVSAETFVSKSMQWGIDNETLANNFAGLVVEYLTAEDKSAKSGQKFWPKFRDIRQYAINFQEIENVNVFRKHVIARIQGQKG